MYHGQKLFTNSQLLPSAKGPLNSSKSFAKLEKSVESSIKSLFGGDGPEPGGRHSHSHSSSRRLSRVGEEENNEEIWWKTGPGMTIRKRPYGNYKGGTQKYIEGSRIQSAFIAENSYVRRSEITDQTLTGEGGGGGGGGGRGGGGGASEWSRSGDDYDVNEATPVERFLVAVPHPQPKQKVGPKLLPIRLHDREWSRKKKFKEFTKDQEEEKRLVLELGGLE